MLGGVLLFEISLAEPFFTVKLRVIECSRLQAKSSSALVNQVGDKPSIIKTEFIFFTQTFIRFSVYVKFRGRL